MKSSYYLCLFCSLLSLSVGLAEPTNIAPLYGVALPDTYWYNRVPERAIDGDPGTEWSAGSHATPSSPHWLIVDLQNQYKVTQITVSGWPWGGDPYFGYTNIYNLYTSTNGTDWALIASDWWAEDTDPSIYSDTYILSGEPLRYVKYEVIGGTHWAGVGEIEIYANIVTVPIVSTLPPADVTKRSATLKGSISDDGGEACQYRFRYKEEKGNYVYTSWAGSVTAGQDFNEPISDLKPNGTYCFNAQARNSAGESEWGNGQSFATCPVEFKITRARMVSPCELGVDMKVTFPGQAPAETPRKVDFWANVNGQDVVDPCDITQLVGPGETAEVFLTINFLHTQPKVPRFTDNLCFTLYGKAYWEGGQCSDVNSISVKIPLPVIIVHGVATNIIEEIFDWKPYVTLQEFLTDNGYDYHDTWLGRRVYKTLWGPPGVDFSSQDDTADDLARMLDGWVNDARTASYADKVNIIGHSLGGLIGRYYITERNRGGVVRRLIMIGTPNEGSSEFYMRIFQLSRDGAYEMLHSHAEGRPPNLRNWLLPTYPCLYNGMGKKAELVPNLSPNLFQPYDRPAPDGVTYYNIYNTELYTPDEVAVRPTKGGAWYEYVGVRTEDWGDGTVLWERSAATLGCLMPVRTDTEHAWLPGDKDVQTKVLEALWK